MKGQCWMKISPNNIRLEVKTSISFISFHPTILVYKLKHWIHFRCFHPAISTCKNLPLHVTFPSSFSVLCPWFHSPSPRTQLWKSHVQMKHSFVIILSANWILKHIPYFPYELTKSSQQYLDRERNTKFFWINWLWK